jgi:hypothetical protein
VREGIARRKEVNEEEAESGNLNADTVNSESGPDYQIYIQLGWAPW